MTHSLLAGAGRGVREPSSFGAGQLDALSRACGIPLHEYRVDHVAERVGRTVERERLSSVADLPALLRRDRAARARFRRAIAISVTSRFRDPQQFELLQHDVLPELIATHRELRVWSAGCATGLELAGVGELIDSLRALRSAHLLGSDLLEENISIARAGTADGAPIAPAIAARARWEVRDLTAGEAPEGSFALILCRNVGIYFAPHARDRLMRMLAGALAPGGALLLGRSERLSQPERYGLEARADHCYRRPR